MILPMWVVPVRHWILKLAILPESNHPLSPGISVDLSCKTNAAYLRHQAAFLRRKLCISAKAARRNCRAFQ
jgi:hypothetical protein